MSTDRRYHFGRFTLDPGARVLMLGTHIVPLPPKAVETLAALVERAGDPVSKDALMDRLWPDGFVEEGNLTQNVYLLRRALREGGLAGAIETLPRRGYRFVAPTGPTRAIRRRPSIAAAACVAFLIAVAIAGTILVPSRRPLSPESQRLYALGRYQWNLRSADGLRQAVRDFGAVVKHDPESPLGYAGLADAYVGISDYVCTQPCPTVAALAESAAREAVARGARSAEAHTSLAMVLHVFQHDYARSDDEFRRAIAIDSHYALAHEWYGNSLLLRGRIAAARRELESAVALQPVSPATYAWLAHDAYFDRRYRDAIENARQVLAIQPHRIESVVLLGLAQEQAGDSRAAIETFATLPVRGGEAIQSRVLVAEVRARNGERTQALDALDPQDERLALRSGFGNEIAFAWLALGNYDRALSIIRATHYDDETQRRFFALDPRLDSVRHDRRFQPWIHAD